MLKKIQEEARWRKISATPGLTEQFMEENANKVDWYSILKYQTLSDDFVKKHGKT